MNERYPNGNYPANYQSNYPNNYQSNYQNNYPNAPRPQNKNYWLLALIPLFLLGIVLGASLNSDSDSPSDALPYANVGSSAGNYAAPVENYAPQAASPAPSSASVPQTSASLPQASPALCSGCYGSGFCALCNGTRYNDMSLYSDAPCSACSGTGFCPKCFADTIKEVKQLNLPDPLRAPLPF